MLRRSFSYLAEWVLWPTCWGVGTGRYMCPRYLCCGILQILVSLFTPGLSVVQ